MGFNCGIVGLPNVGKSTIFNALTSGKAQAANYPFCTIDPNTGVVAVPDERLNKLADMAKSAKVIPTSVEFVDIAGLVAGASKGEGLGNQFLGHIRGVDAIVHVVRCFDDENITHVNGSVGPKRDVEIIETELLLSDLSLVEKRIERIQKGAKTGDKALIEEMALLEPVYKSLGEGRAPRGLDAEAKKALSAVGLLTVKPVVFVANVDESDVSQTPEAATNRYLMELVTVAKDRDAGVVVISGKVEEEIAQLSLDERAQFLDALGLQFSGLDRLALAGYKLLDLLTFFTVGPKEAHAWTCKQGDNAVDAAGKIHTDFATGFIRAEVISYDDFVSSGGEIGARERGLMRTEGKSYLMHDGDIVHFRFNV